MSPLLAAGSTTSSTISNVEPGLLGFLVVAALGIALVFLLRSMNKQFRKIGPRPEDPEDTEAEGASAAPSQRPLRGLAAHRAAVAAADAEAQREQSEAERD
ncbi:MAG TPA: hypothetical protein VGM12_20335 [Trebonia sp.]